jgi:hypothetical protein
MKGTRWPPKDGRAYVRSDEFGKLVVEELDQLRAVHPRLDLVDAAAITFHWFNSKLNANRSFIGKKRFPTIGRFRAYVRQILYNAGVKALRLRRRRKQIEAIRGSARVVDTPAVSAQRLEQLQRLVDRLEETHQLIFTRYFLDEEPLELIACALVIDEVEAQRLYEDAVDQIRRLAKKSIVR